MADVRNAEAVGPVGPAPDSGHTAEVVELTGPLDTGALRRAVAQVARETDVLRPLADAEEPLPVVDLGAEPDPAAAAHAWVRAHTEAGRAPEPVWALLRLAPDLHHWFHRHDRASVDAYGCSLISRRVAEVYGALTEGPSDRATDGRLTDHAPRVDPAVRAADRAHWSLRLKDRPEPVTLARADGAGPGGGAPVRSGAVPLGAAGTHAVRAAARYAGVPVRTVLSAAVAAYVHRVTGATDLVLGLPVDGRTERAQLRSPAAAGHTVPLRLTVRPGTRFADLVEQVAEESRAARAHQRSGHAELCAALGLPHDHPPLYGPVVDVRVPGAELRFGALAATVRRVGPEPVEDLRIVLDEDPADRGLLVVLHGASDRYSTAELDGHAARFGRLLVAAGAAPGHPLASYELLDAAQTSALSYGAVPRQDTTAHTLTDLLQDAADAHADAVAVRDRDTRLTYRELHERADRLAHFLIARGVGPEQVVGLLLGRSAQTVVAMLAVLKTGAAYLPLDPAYPAERLRFMIGDARPSWVIAEGTEAADTVREHARQVLVLDDADTRAALAASPSGAPVDSDRTAPLRPSHPAYVIYTSGSSGTPKGVVVPHRAVAPLVRWVADEFGAEAMAHTLAATSFSFDVSVAELYPPLTRGGTVEIVGNLLSLLDDDPPGWSGGLLCAIPSVFNSLLESEALEVSATTVAMAGEALPAALADRVRTLLPGTTLRNIYGPTEATVYATSWTDGEQPGAPEAGAPPIGRPLPHVRAYVLDGALRPVEPGRPGELYLAGESLALGYLRRPALSAERFVADPYGPPGARMYRTGDLASRREDGRLDFLGRVDAQVKVNGFRIEPGEVEAVLAGHPDVAEAMAVVHRDPGGAGRLSAYVVRAPGPGGAEVEELRDWVASRLPRHLVPADFSVVGSLPRTGSGKLDRGAPVPVPEPGAPGGALPSGPPQSPEGLGLPDGLEKPDGGEGHDGPGKPDERGGDEPTSREALVVQVFGEVLRKTDVRPEDGFFELGGDSIMSIQLVSRLRRAGLVLTPQDVFEHKTVRALARIARETRKPVQRDAATGVGDVPLTPIVHWLRELDGPIDGFHQLVVLQTPAGVRQDLLRGAVQKLIDHHDALRLRLDHRTRDWRLEVRAPGSVSADSCVRRVDARGGESVEALLAEAVPRAKSELDVQEGSMARVVWLDAGDEATGRLVFMLHHLACDGVSWRILVPDLISAYQQLEEGSAPSLRPVETTLREWSAALTEQAEQPARVAELPLWQKILATGGPQLAKRPLDPARDVTSRARNQVMTYPADRARHLYSTIPAAFHCEINDVLLTTFAVAVQQVLGTEEDVVLDVEAHGREPVVPGADLSRTAGWFTSMYPLRIAPGSVGEAGRHDFGRRLGRAVHRVKEDLRAVPDKGIGFGMLRHLNPGTADAFADAAARHIGFNYFGRFLLPAAAGAQEWGPAPEAGMSAGADADMPLSHPLSVNALTRDTDQGPALDVSFMSPEDILIDDDVVELIGHTWFETLDALAAHAEEPDAGGRTPSDFPLTALTQEDVERLEEAYPGFDDVLPLSPLQQGLLYHVLLGGLNEDAVDGTEHGVYTTQVWLELEGPLDLDRLRRAGQDLLGRHANLSAAFVHDGLPEPVQVFGADATLPWRVEELTTVLGDRLEEELERLLLHERSKPFTPDAPPMMRMMLVKLGDDRHRVVMTSHHILLDGWSLPVMLHDFFTFYRQAGGVDTDVALPANTPFREYLSWLSSVDDADVEAAWRNALDGLTGSTHIALEEGSADPVPPGNVLVELDEATTLALVDTARRHGATLNTVLQTGWGIVMGQETGNSDVVFGSVVSGRPAELTGVETMVGMFINTVPTRVRLDPAETFGALMSRLQREQAALMPYQHVSLGEIRRITDIGNPFDTVMAFENYPLDGEALAEPAPGLKVVAAHGNDAPHFPLSLIVSPRGERLQVGFDFRPHLLPEEKVRALADRFAALLTTIAEEPARPVGSAVELAESAPAADVADAVEAAVDSGIGVLLPLRTTGEQPPVFCVHPAAGISWSYAGLSRPLGTDRPLYGLQARGLDGTDVLPASLSEMAADYLEHVRSVRPTGPYHLLGWSFGGLVAHEMAVQLQADGEQVATLSVLDAFPSPPSALPDGEPSDGGPVAGQDVLAMVLEFFGYDRSAWAGETLTYPRFVQIAHGQEGLLASFDEEQVAAVARIFSNNATLSRDHRPGRFEGDLLMFLARESAPEVAEEQWRPLVDGEVELHEVDCSHGEMGRPQPLGEIGRTLRTRL
ncbi:Linear gramicidin synthase subunit D [Streptomyces sp. YIM 130001]|uniref:non-ribosomal peptide synthetase n=1 Tax=Streptomyces sp. YIM 130001 TaxID=2259644 RepID=UPI000E655E56|nr:non-ribosomal peptide synthetase [Streptomyces sp. YIM 130001]RII13773.1 Linear gramicidin synthase subunit D [Streptomyces sp. YIM 130001]